MRPFFSFLTKPIYLKTENIDWSLFLKLMLFYYIIAFPVGLLVGTLIKILRFTESEFNYPIIKILVVGLLLGPVIEEMLFRLLLKPRYRNIIILLGFSIYMIIRSISKSDIKYLVIFLFIGFLMLLLSTNEILLRKFQRILLKRFHILFYLSCFLFGLIHLTNYQPVSYKLFVFMPIIIMPQVIGGAFFGYIRMKFGIIFSFIFHSLTNFFPVLVLIISQLFDRY